MSDIPSTYDKITDGKCYWYNEGIINVGSREDSINGLCGHIFGDTNDRDLDLFIAPTDTIIINVDFEKDEISFESSEGQIEDNNNKRAKIVRQLKKGINTIRFCAELKLSDSVIQFVD